MYNSSSKWTSGIYLLHVNNWNMVIVSIHCTFLLFALHIWNMLHPCNVRMLNCYIQCPGHAFDYIWFSCFACNVPFSHLLNISDIEQPLLPCCRHIILFSSTFSTSILLHNIFLCSNIVLQDYVPVH